MVDLSESGDPINDINGLAEVVEPGTVVVAIGQVNDVRLYRDLLASGIQDYLLKQLSAGKVHDALNIQQTAFLSPRRCNGEPFRQHVSTAVIGPRLSDGDSMRSTPLSWLFSTHYTYPPPLPHS